MSDDLRSTDYDALIAEKTAIERTISRRQESIKKIVQDIQALYQVSEEEEAKHQFITTINNDWEPERKAFELWSGEDDIDAIEDIILALKRKKAALAAECSEVTTQLRDMKKDS